MKKVFSIVAIALVAMTFASCEKSYTCECSWNLDNGDGTTTSGSWSTTIEAKKKDAKDACNAAGASYLLLGGGCEIK
jgi:hypothetical protein